MDTSDLPPEMIFYEYPFRKVAECPIKDKFSDSLKDGIILGWTTIKEAFELGGKYSKGDDGVQYIELNGRRYSDVDGYGVIKELIFYLRDNLPEYWSNKGLSSSLSFNEVVAWLKRMNYYYKIEEREKFDDIFFATIKAKDIYHDLNLEFDFNSVSGQKESDPNTLLSIKFNRKRIHTERSDYSPFLPIEGVTIGQTNVEELKSLGFKVSGEQSIAVNKKRPVTYFRYNEKSGIVDRITIPGAFMPIEWPEAEMYVPMTYRKWLSYFDKYGFDLQKNEAIDSSIYMSPQLIAVQPQIGIKVTVTLISLFKVKREANNPKSIMECEITLI